MKLSTEIRQRLAGISEQMNGLVNKSRSENRDWTVEEDQQYSRMAEEVTKLATRLKAAEQQESAEESLKKADEINEESRSRMKVENPEKAEKEQRYSDVFLKNMIYGTAELTQEERSVLFSRKSEKRALAGNSGAGAVYLPEDMQRSIIMAMKDYASILQHCDYFETSTGLDIPIPTGDDTGNVGEQLAGQNTAATDQDMSTGEVVLKAWPFSSKFMKFSNQFIRDEQAGVISRVNRMAAERLGRLWNTQTASSVADGSTGIQGLPQACPLGRTTAGAAAVTSDELLDFIHSIDPAYRNNRFRLFFNDNTLLAISKLKDSTNRPQFQMTFAEGMPATIHGRRFEIWSGLPNMAAAARFAVAGDPSYYSFRVAGGLSMSVARERFIDLNQTGFIIFADADGRYTGGTAGPLKYMRNA